MQALPSHCPDSLTRIKLLSTESLLLAELSYNTHMIPLKRHQFARGGLRADGRIISKLILETRGFPGGTLAVKNLPAKAGDAASIPGSGRSPGRGNGNPLQDSSLGNPLDRGAWLATVHGVTKSQTGLSNCTHTHTHTHTHTRLTHTHIHTHTRTHARTPELERVAAEVRLGHRGPGRHRY